MSDHNYTRSLIDGLWTIDVPSFSKEIETALSGKAFTVRANHDDVIVSFADTLTAPEISTLDDIVSDHSGESAPITGGPHLEQEYDNTKRLIRETLYAKANLDGTFSNRTEETLYTWQGAKILSSVRKTYDRNGIEISNLATTYSTEQVTGNTIVRQKRV